MSLLATTLLFALGSDAFAQDRVVGGVPAAAGDWPDTAALFSRGGTFVCTGVLVAPDVILTAAHCDLGLHHAILDTVDYTLGGERIDIVDVISYPSSWVTYDLAVVLLASESRVAPRQVAWGCAASEYLGDGASTTIVGYGATDTLGSQWGTVLMQARAPVVDHDCSDLSRGCNELVSPGGELIAGGNGVDSCNGDSGGPLYLDTPHGPMLVGLTSRSTDDATQVCGDGGVYVRADAVVAWVEAESGRTLPEPDCPWQANARPLPTAAPIVTDEGRMGTTTVRPGDPDPADHHWFDVVEAPAHGRAEVTGNGVVRYRPAVGFDGRDQLTVRVRDSGYPQQQADLVIPITVRDTVTGLTITRHGCDSAPVDVWWGALALLGIRRRR